MPHRHFWQLPGSLPDEQRQQDANARAEEANALLDRAEATDCTAADRAALLSDASALLYHAGTETPALAQASQRLQRLL